MAHDVPLCKGARFSKLQCCNTCNILENVLPQDGALTPLYHVCSHTSEEWQGSLRGGGVPCFLTETVKNSKPASIKRTGCRLVAWPYLRHHRLSRQMITTAKQRADEEHCNVISTAILLVSAPSESGVG
jgi:hypothetical protein